MIWFGEACWDGWAARRPPGVGQGKGRGFTKPAIQRRRKGKR